MVKFSHSIFALPFALIGMMLAAQALPRKVPEPGRVGLIILCMVAARSFAMTFNRLLDAAIDARNPRTAGRPLPSGRLSRSQAKGILVAAAMIFVAGCAGFFAFANRWPFLLSPIVLAYLAFYSFTKRFTAWSHFVLGAAIATSPVAAWIAVHPASLGWPALLLAGAVAAWIAGFDIIYSCQDVDVDRREGLFSIPVRLGIADALFVSRLCHVLTVALLAGLGGLTGAGPLYWLGLGVVTALLIVEQSLVRPNDLSRVNLAFFTVNGVVSVAFAAAVIADLLLRRPAG